jgi:outer membrane biosynthesis protein TonB
MIDLFGMGKAAPEAADAPEHRKPQAGSHGLWLSLLVLDSVFVIVFGGAVAAKVYQYWKTPAVVVAPLVRRRPVPKAPEAAKAAEPAPAPKPPAPAPEAPKPVAKPEPRIARDAPRPPKPSLLNEAPKPRSTPSPATSASAASAAASSSSAPAKAQPVVFKLRSPKADSVQLVGAFIVRGGRKDMTEAGDGTWSVKLYLNPGQYRYFFSVDKKKTLDPENPNSDRGASLLTVP